VSWPRKQSRHTALRQSSSSKKLWLLVAGIWLAIGHITTGIAMCLTIIGIPMGIASFKMVPVSLMPLGNQIVSSRTGDFGYVH